MEALKNIPLSVGILVFVALLLMFIPLLLSRILTKKIGVLDSEDYEGFRILFFTNLIPICLSAWIWYGVLTEGLSSLGIIGSAVWLVSMLVVAVIVLMSLGLGGRICFYNTPYRDNPRELNAR